MGNKAILKSVPNQKPATKEIKKQKSLKEFANGMLLDLASKAKQEKQRLERDDQRKQENEVARMIFGPGWCEDEIPILMASGDD